jgi:hypothetical protein
VLSAAPPWRGDQSLSLIAGADREANNSKGHAKRASYFRSGLCSSSISDAEDLHAPVRVIFGASLAGKVASSSRSSCRSSLRHSLSAFLFLCMTSSSFDGGRTQVHHQHVCSGGRDSNLMRTDPYCFAASIAARKPTRAGLKTAASAVAECTA